MGKSIKIELTKIEGAQITDGFICLPIPEAGKGAGGFFTNKAGERVYMDTVLWENEEADEYDNFGALQLSMSKDEREAGAKGAYIGNLKIW